MGSKRCPPGIVCLSPMVGLSLAMAVVILLLGVYFVTVVRDIKPPNIIVEMPQQQQEPRPQPQIVQMGDRYNRAPEPLREWATQPDLRGALLPRGSLPIFQPAAGYPDQFQQMGILTIEGTSQILPLYGRRAGNRSDRYNYYTRTDSYNPIQLPINYERRDCMDDIGCNELFGGETLKIDGMNSFAKVNIYKYNAPRYIPAVL